MIGIAANGITIHTGRCDELYSYQLRAMVRVLGLAMQAPECDSKDRELIVDYLNLMEEMLPDGTQLVVSPNPDGRG